MAGNSLMRTSWHCATGCARLPGLTFIVTFIQSIRALGTLGAARCGRVLAVYTFHSRAGHLKPFETAPFWLAGRRKDLYEVHPNSFLRTVRTCYGAKSARATWPWQALGARAWKSLEPAAPGSSWGTGLPQYTWYSVRWSSVVVAWIAGLC